MKSFKNYKKHVEVDMVKYSGDFHFNEQLRQEGTNIKINNKDSQIIDNVNKTIRAIVRNYGSEFNESKEERSVMIDKKYDYKAGDYVEYLDDMYLTNTAIDKDNPFFNTTKITRCNYVLKWMDENGLHEQPCIVINNTKYTGGTKSLITGVTEVDAMVNITIQANENTNKIGYGKRFYTMKNAWRVTLIDDITTKNVLSWTLGKDSLNLENDNEELGICDFYEHDYAISLKSTSEQIIENGTYQILPIVTDEKKIVPNPHVMYKSSDENIATVDANGKVTALKIGNCNITCSIGDKSIVLAINIIAKPSIPIDTYQVVPSNGYLLKLASSTSLECRKYSDSVQIPCNVQYTLDSIGTSLLANKKIDIQYKETKDSNGNSLGINIVWIKNLNCTTATSFTITITDKDDTSKIITTQTIQLKGV